MGSPTVPSSNPNHFAHLRMKLNLSRDVMIFEGSPPQDVATFDTPIDLDNHRPNINNFMIKRMAIQVLPMTVEQQIIAL